MNITPEGQMISSWNFVTFPIATSLSGSALLKISQKRKGKSGFASKCTGIKFQSQNLESALENVSLYEIAAQSDQSLKSSNFRYIDDQNSNIHVILTSQLSSMLLLR